MNAASQMKELLRQHHYAIESATHRQIVAQQYDYQMYPNRLEQLLKSTGPAQLKIIPIGDAEVEGDFWVIPFNELEALLTSENLTQGFTKKGKRRRARWRFHLEHHLFVLYPGNGIRLGEINTRKFYGAELLVLP